MDQQTKIKIAVVVVYTATAVAIGRYTVPEKVKIETKIVEVEKKSTASDVDSKKDTHKQVTVTKTFKPDGEKTITVVTTNDTTSDQNVAKKDIVDIDKTNDQSKEITHPSDKVTVSALAGFDLSSFKMIYGASVTKPIVGPLTVGLFVLSNPAAGVSIGLTF
jgi:PKD repeat protein